LKVEFKLEDELTVGAPMEREVSRTVSVSWLKEQESWKCSVLRDKCMESRVGSNEHKFSF
jgi:hypothetical protein